MYLQSSGYSELLPLLLDYFLKIASLKFVNSFVLFTVLNRAARNSPIKQKSHNVTLHWTGQKAASLWCYMRPYKITSLSLSDTTSHHAPIPYSSAATLTSFLFPDQISIMWHLYRVFIFWGCILLVLTWLSFYLIKIISHF